MKGFIISICLLASYSTFADPISFDLNLDQGPINVRNYTCNDLKEKLQVEGVLYIKVFSGRFEIYSREYVNEERPCRYFNEYIVKNYVRTKDKWYCWAGYKCEAPPPVGI